MTGKQFIFSNERKYLLTRHLSFWIAFSIACFVTGAYPYKPKDLLSTQFYKISLIWVACFLPVSIFCTYLFLHFVWPLLFKKNDFFKTFFAIGIASLFLIFVSSLLNRIGLLWRYGSVQETDFHERLQLAYYHSLVFTVLLGSLITSVIVIKSRYLQVEENTSLYQQKAYKELNLLKSNIYPSFLFNSLTTLRNELNVSSTKAAKVLLNLSDILSYLLYDSHAEQVALKKEIMIIKNYVEVIRPGHRSAIEFADYTSEEAGAHFIPPLILFSLMQTVFSDRNNSWAEPSFVQIAVSMESNDFAQLVINYCFEGLHDTQSYKQSQLKKIEEALTIFPMTDKKLAVVNNDSQIHFSVLIKTSGSHNFSGNATELKN